MRAIFVLLTVFQSTTSVALPEFSRYGYFSCTSCHVSPGGGGLLTPYGRGFTEEKLATWSRENAGEAFHGLVREPSEKILIGGHWRQMQYYESGSERHRGRYFPMQRSLELGVLGSSFGLVADVHIEDAQDNPTRDNTVLISREHYARYVASENFQARVGRFSPKFGLMIPQHPSYIRSGLGFFPGSETYNGEIGFFSENHEFIFSYIFGEGGGPLRGGSYLQTRINKAAGASASYSTFLSHKNRVSISLLRYFSEAKTRNVVGVSGSFALGQSFGFLTEMDLAFLQSQNGTSTRNITSYNKIFYESMRGIFPGILFERLLSESNGLETREDTFGLITQWHPRPHFEIELFVGGRVSRPEFSYSDLAYLMCHYYL